MDDRSPESKPANRDSGADSLREDVLTHITKSAVKGVSDGLGLNLSEKTEGTAATWIVNAAKTVPLFIGPGRLLTTVGAYGASAGLYGMSEMKWGDSAENMTKDFALGGLKGVATKGSMDLLGKAEVGLGLQNSMWAVPGKGVALGASSTFFDTALSRGTYHDQSGNYRGLGYGLGESIASVANLENLGTSAATFTLGAAGMKALQSKAAMSVFPNLATNRIFQTSATGFTFGAVSGMEQEAHKQVKDGGFNAWELDKYDFGRIGKEGLFRATSDGAGAALGGRFTPRPETIKNVERIDKPAGIEINNRAEISSVVEAPVRKAVADLWDKNIKTVDSGVFHSAEPKWSPFPSHLGIGEYEPPYERMKLGPHGRFVPADERSLHPPDEQAERDPLRRAYIVIDEPTLSPENQRIAREIGRIRDDRHFEISVPAPPDARAQDVEQSLLKLTERFEPQPLRWGVQTPLQFYRSELNVDHGIPDLKWMNEAVSTPEFRESGRYYDPGRNLVFPSEEMAKKYAARTPREPSWDWGPEPFSHMSRGGWKQAYGISSVHMYTPEGQGIERSDPSNSRRPSVNFALSELSRPENRDYYLSDKEHLFELFGTKAFRAVADRHWLEMRKLAYEAVEKHWPAASIEKDRATNLGTLLLARAWGGQGYFEPHDTGFMEIFVPKYAWRHESGQVMHDVDVVHTANKIMKDVVDGAIAMPFDHNFAKQVLTRVESPDGDQFYDRVQFRQDDKRALAALLQKPPEREIGEYADILTGGLRMRVHPRYLPLIQDVAAMQKQGSVPSSFGIGIGSDGMLDYTPVYRTATVEERIVPLSELLKNLKIVDYGFKNARGPVLGKLSLASHDVHDHARTFWMLEKEGFFSDDGTALPGPGYGRLMSRLSDPLHTGIFKREGEMVASVAYDWRSFYNLHPLADPPLSMDEMRGYFTHAERMGAPLTENQLSALKYVEQLRAADPEGKTEEARRLRHIVGGVWMEFLEQKRKTETTLWQRSDGTFQRMNMINPEYMSFVIDAVRAMDKHAPDMREAINRNNFQLESYLQDLARPGSEVSQLHFSADDITEPKGEAGGLPPATRKWLIRHPGFTTRRAPIRDWLTGEGEPIAYSYFGSDEERQDFRRLIYGP